MLEQEISAACKLDDGLTSPSPGKPDFGPLAETEVEQNKIEFDTSSSRFSLDLTMHQSAHDMESEMEVLLDKLKDATALCERKDGKIESLGKVVSSLRAENDTLVRLSESARIELDSKEHAAAEKLRSKIEKMEKELESYRDAYFDLSAQNARLIDSQQEMSQNFKVEREARELAEKEKAAYSAAFREAQMQLEEIASQELGNLTREVNLEDGEVDELMMTPPPSSKAFGGLGKARTVTTPILEYGQLYVDSPSPPPASNPMALGNEPHVSKGSHEAVGDENTQNSQNNQNNQNSQNCPIKLTGGHPVPSNKHSSRLPLRKIRKKSKTKIPSS
jgi:hypothetical protein